MRLFRSFPKFHYVRSAKLLAACHLIGCQNCGRIQSEPAHSNWSIHGKGGSIKASDQYVAALCRYCHHLLDQGAIVQDEKQRLWWPAHVKTVLRLIELGHWPLAVPVPDIVNCPWPLAA